MSLIAFYVCFKVCAKKKNIFVGYWDGILRKRCDVSLTDNNFKTFNFKKETIEQGKIIKKILVLNHMKRGERDRQRKR